MRRCLTATRDTDFAPNAEPAVQWTHWSREVEEGARSSSASTTADCWRGRDARPEPGMWLNRLGKSAVRDEQCASSAQAGGRVGGLCMAVSGWSPPSPSSNWLAWCSAELWCNW